MKRKRNNSHFVLFVVIIFVLLLFYVWQHNTIVRMGYALEEKRKEKEALLTIYRELNVKVISLKAPYRIKENLRRHHISLKVPGEKDIVIMRK